LQMSHDPFTKLKQNHSPDKRRSTAALTFPLTAWSALMLAGRSPKPMSCK